MTSTARTPYRVTDQLFLWLLTDPDEPAAIGTLHMVRSTRGVRRQTSSRLPSRSTGPFLEDQRRDF